MASGAETGGDGVSRCRRCQRPSLRFDRWSLRYKGFELGQIECLSYFKIKNSNKEPSVIELWPMNKHAQEMVDSFSLTNDDGQ